MRIDRQSQTVSFSYGDMHFIKKYGIAHCTEMALAYAENCDLPFLADTHQLAAFLGMRHRSLHELMRNLDTSYRAISLKKRHGGVRCIHAPCPALSSVQRRILIHILNKLPLSRYAMAYRKGVTLADNALPHCHKKYLLKLDLADFFGSIRFDQILSTVFNTNRFPRQIGTMLTSLCCHNDVLPQGAPTSPALSNLVMKHFDDVMGAWCAKQGLAYTRYCDDITISGDTPLYVAYIKARALLEQMGFTLNERKTHFVSNSNRQAVTGLTVNEKPSIPREYRRNLRQEIYYLQKYSVNDAILHGNRTAFIEDGEPQSLRYLTHLEGKLLYVLQFHPEEYWKRALRAVRQLLRDEWQERLMFPAQYYYMP